MKILITGANGAIGSDLVSFFSKDSIVYAIYRSENFVNKTAEGHAQKAFSPSH